MQLACFVVGLWDRLRLLDRPCRVEIFLSESDEPFLTLKLGKYYSTGMPEGCCKPFLFFYVLIGFPSPSAAFLLLYFLFFCGNFCHDSFRTYLAGYELSLADVAVYVKLSQSRYTPPKVRERPPPPSYPPPPCSRMPLSKNRCKQVFMCSFFFSRKSSMKTSTGPRVPY